MAALGWVPADHLLSSGPCRAWQLFDWVRLLPACDELRRFCHSSTYVTMIALCGTWRQLRRALELVADMRSRDMECGLPVSTPQLDACCVTGLAWTSPRRSEAARCSRPGAGCRHECGLLIHLGVAMLGQACGSAVGVSCSWERHTHPPIRQG